MTCTLYQISLGRTNQGVWDWRST